VRAGAVTLGSDMGAEITRGRDGELLDLEELAALDAMGYAALDADDHEETTLGIDDDDTDPAAGNRPHPRTSPRVRPRGHS
jgi:hypothetical protein